MIGAIRALSIGHEEVRKLKCCGSKMEKPIWEDLHLFLYLIVMPPFSRRLRVASNKTMLLKQGYEKPLKYQQKTKTY